MNTSNQIMIPCGRQLQDRRSTSKPNPGCDEIQKCPRCDSSNTKFCYYNNYSLAQPRHFCKACKRYWTKGGALRNVPVGGGCRKNKRSKQRSVDQAAPTHSTPVSGEDTTSRLSSRHCDLPSNAAKSSQREFSAGSSSSHGFFVGSDGIEATTGLAFERLDEGEESFPGNSLPLSINWAAGQASADQTTLHLQPFDHRSTILGLNLGGHHVKQESTGLQNSDLSPFFDPQLNVIGRTQPHLGADTVGLHYNQLCMDSYGMAPSANEIQWRFPPPRLVTMMEGGHEGYGPNSRSANQLAAIESMRSDPSLRSIMRSKSALEENMSVSATLIASTQEADRLPCEWPSNPVEGFFGDSGDGNSPYWSNGSWPQDDIYEDDQLG